MVLFGFVSGRLGPVLGGSGRVLCLSWAVLGRSGPSRVCLGAVLGPSWAWGPSGDGFEAVLDNFGVNFGAQHGVIFEVIFGVVS